MMQQGKLLGLTLISAAALVACGGGGGGSASGGTGLSGSVIDGAIEGAVVCLDLNNSLGCDAGEPNATTKADGSYALNTTGLTSAQIKNAHIFVTVPTTAKDADDGGQTLAQAGKASFNLLAPAESAVANDGSIVSSVVVSPITTLVSHQMMLDGTSLTTAKGKVQNALGLASTVDVSQNFAGKSDTTSQDLLKKAQFLAVALGEVMKTIQATSPASADKTRLLGALDHLKTNAKAIIDAAASAPSSQTPLQAVQTALQTPALTPVVSTLLSNAQTAANSSPVIGATTSDFDTIVKEGFYSGSCANSTGSTASTTGDNTTTYTCNQWSMNYTKSSEPGKWLGTRYYANTGDTSFTTSTTMPYSSYRLVDGSGWVQNSVNPTSGTYATVDSGLFAVTQKWTDSFSETFKVRMSYKDVGGMKFSEVGTLGNMSDILRFGTSGIGNTVFPPGSRFVQTRSEGRGDTYWLDYRPMKAWTPVEAELASFNELLATFATPIAPSTPTTGFHASISFNITNNGGEVTTWYQATFDAGGTSTGGTMTVWKQESGQTPVALTDKASYSFRTVGGQTLLVLAPSPTIQAARMQQTGSGLMWEPFFAVRDGKLSTGAFISSAAATVINGVGTSWNRTAAQAIVQAMGVSTLPQ